MEVIVSLPDKTLRHYSTKIPRAELENVIEQLRQTVQIRSRRQFYQPARQLYNWLIRPALEELADNNIKTLTFVSDGSLRNIPMSVLHDGKRYLIEQYNVALTPGLQLLAPLSLEKVKLKTLAAGITQQRRGFYALEHVNDELENIQQQTNGVILRNEAFTKNALQEKLARPNFK